MVRGGKRLLATLVSMVAATTAVVGGAGPSTAAEPGPMWDQNGPGEVASGQPATIRWDNTGNPAADVVPRDDTQVLQHAGPVGGRPATFEDVNPLVRGKIDDLFADASVRVSQTAGLTSQAVRLDFAGLPTRTPIKSKKTGEVIGYQAPEGSLRVLQCWGAMSADGKPDPNATAPDPETCVEGFQGRGMQPGSSTLREVIRDPLAKGGDWKTTKDDFGQEHLRAPFLNIAGARSSAEESFDVESTNEQGGIQSQNDEGTTSVDFQLQTTNQNSNLGCGLRSGSPTTPSCWIVVVPNLGGVSWGFPRNQRDWTPDQVAAAEVSLPTVSPLAPSLWAHRMQVKLAFNDLGANCPDDEGRALTAGSELLQSAMDSWIPAMCGSVRTPVGFSKTTDERARSFVAGTGTPAVAVTYPQPGTTPAPVAVAGVGIAYEIDLQSGFDERGYTHLLGILPDLRLNARLVAKLLTQNYQMDAINAQGPDEYVQHVPWFFAADPPYSVFKDPEFLKINPEYARKVENGEWLAVQGRLMVEGLRSDAGAAVWKWLLNDPAARSFLAGCPDPSGMTINPFYSDRTYVGCTDRKAELDAANLKKRAETDSPSGFDKSLTLSYPSESMTYPVLNWYDTTVADEGVPRSMTNVFLPLSDQAAVARQVFRATDPGQTFWCSNGNPDCWQDGMEGNGTWVTQKLPIADVGNRRSMGVTDLASAMSQNLHVASLCNEDGSACVAPSPTTLAKGAASFTPSTTAGFVEPDVTPDYAGGAYPLTLPVTMALNTRTMLPQDKGAYARMLGYVAKEGQVPGRSAGQLPLGYAPMTPAMVKQTEAAIAALTTKTAATSRPQATARPTPAQPDGVPEVAPPVGAPAGQDTPGSAGLPTGGAGTDTGPAAAGTATDSTDDRVLPNPGRTTKASAAVAPSDAKVLAAQTGRTTGSPLGIPRYLLLICVGVAGAAGAASFVVGRRREEEAS